MKSIKPLAFLALLWTALASQSVGKAEETPQVLLENTINDVINILHQGPEVSVEDKGEQILSTLQKQFSFDIIIRRTLGRNWTALNEGQQDQITTLITDLLIKAYTNELTGAKKPEVNVVKTEELGSNKIEIFTTVSYKNNLVSVSYRLANISGRGWQVYDILIEGTSLVANYRRQFDEHFQTKTAKDLLDLLKEKIAAYDK
ncbi:MlaC/ttg2D family ABC transporter substrate-binding protein [Pelagicoccus albus]|uniref:ABC transporter substrate-binding protein n=1 Tax=Pelagicoccus albus TaxID=415222 RepID=A0A7X1B4P0_9BACT|nr:ABC transporter substrate-binding protein [Pelagicoccus albus]MBC2605545.1 ABC transporter substrate-binding protein [Pelagicoccus albus]